MKNVIYKLYFRDEPEKVYIGSAVNSDKRIKEHLYSLLLNNHSNKLLQIDFNKKGVSNFTWDIIESDLSRGSLLQKECKYIEKYDSINKGYNLTAITTALHSFDGKKCFTPKDNKYDFSIINQFMKKHKIEIRLMENNIINKFKESTYSKYFWDKLDEKDMEALLTTLHSYMQNTIQKPLKYILCCIDNERAFKYLETNKKKSLRHVYTRVRKFYMENKYQATDIVVVSSLNPFSMDYKLIGDVDEYRVAKLFKLLERQENLSENIVIHLPQSLYDSYSKVLFNRKEVKKTAK